MIRIWEQRRRKGGRVSFIIALWYCLIPQFALVFIPRFCLIGFTFSQPFLISRVLDLLLEPVNNASRHEGYGLVLATAAIYMGIAV
jgi:ATP-binding cassette subfamily C (CFTR/MRP) protein 1